MYIWEADLICSFPWGIIDVMEFRKMKIKKPPFPCTEECVERIRLKICILNTEKDGRRLIFFFWLNLPLDNTKISCNSCHSRKLDKHCLKLSLPHYKYLLFMEVLTFKKYYNKKGYPNNHNFLISFSPVWHLIVGACERQIGICGV